MVAPKPQRPQLTVPQPSNSVESPDHKPSDFFDYEPKPDISAYEVALLLKLGIVTINFGAFKKLPDNVKRHFKVRPRQSSPTKR